MDLLHGLILCKVAFNKGQLMYSKRLIKKYNQMAKESLEMAKRWIDGWFKIRLDKALVTEFKVTVI